MTLSERRKALISAAIDKLVADSPQFVTEADLRKFAEKVLAKGWDLAVKDIERELNSERR